MELRKKSFNRNWTLVDSELLTYSQIQYWKFVKSIAIQITQRRVPTVCLSVWNQSVTERNTTKTELIVKKQFLKKLPEKFTSGSATKHDAIFALTIKCSADYTINCMLCPPSVFSLVDVDTGLSITEYPLIFQLLMNDES